MSLYKEQLEKLVHSKHKGKKWAKNQMNRFIRRQPIADDDYGTKIGRKPTKFWEY